MSYEKQDTNESVEQYDAAYAVFRNGFRVSDSIYPSAFYAQHELDYWKGIIRNWPDGSRIEIRSLRPRVWNNN
jgi:hypothetical protein